MNKTAVEVAQRSAEKNAELQKRWDIAMASVERVLLAIAMETGTAIDAEGGVVAKP